MPSTSALPDSHQRVRRSLGVASIPRTLTFVRPSVMGGAAILCVAILIAAVATTDPLWWHLHFSRLGMFSDFSGYTFNLGVVFSGLVIAASGVPMALHLASAQTDGRSIDPRAARLLPPLLVALGAFLALIGVIPLTVNEFLHDRAANGVLLSFLGLVVVSKRTLPELPPYLARYAIIAVVLLSVGIALMVTGVINLAAFEVVAFGSVLSWVYLLERSVQRLGAPPTTRADDAGIDVREERAPRQPHRDAVQRGTRARVPAIVRHAASGSHAGARRSRPSPTRRAGQTSAIPGVTRTRTRPSPTLRRRSGVGSVRTMRRRAQIPPSIDRL